MEQLKEVISYQKKTMDMIWESMLGDQKTEETENPYGDRPFADPDVPDYGDKVNDDLLDR